MLVLSLQLDDNWRLILKLAACYRGVRSHQRPGDVSKSEEAFVVVAQKVGRHVRDVFLLQQLAAQFLGLFFLWGYMGNHPLKTLFSDKAIVETFSSKFVLPDPDAGLERESVTQTVGVAKALKMSSIGLLAVRGRSGATGTATEGFRFCSAMIS